MISANKKYRDVCPVRLPDKAEREAAIGSLAGEKYRLKKALQAILPLFDGIQHQGPGDWMYENDVDEQSFAQYASAYINHFQEGSGGRNTIYISKVRCKIDKEIFKTLKQGVKAFFPNARVATLKISKPCDPSKEWDEFYSSAFDEKLYSAPKILRYIQSCQLPRDAFCVLALTDHAIYNLPTEKQLYSAPAQIYNSGQKRDPDDWWIFGLGSLKDRVGVVTYKRFLQPVFKPGEELMYKNQDANVKITVQSQQNHAQAAEAVHNQEQKQETADYIAEKTLFDPQLITRNLVKVINHEICHMFGIRHCVYFNCLMNGSSYESRRYRDVNEKFFDLCPVCVRKLQYNMQFDLEARYQGLLKFCQEQDETFSDDVNWYTQALQAVAAAYVHLNKKK